MKTLVLVDPQYVSENINFKSLLDFLNEPDHTYFLILCNFPTGDNSMIKFINVPN